MHEVLRNPVKLWAGSPAATSWYGPTGQPCLNNTADAPWLQELTHVIGSQLAEPF